jgi:dephospho-CoA kinase
MKILGLTGGIGSGKTVVAELLQVMGVPVYDSDTRTKELYNLDETLRNNLMDIFGPTLYENGQLNRTMLATLIFQDPKALKAVNSLVHPAVGRDFMQWVQTHQTASVIAQESAILFEARLDDLYEAIICVSAPESLRISRTCRRNNLKPDEVKDRMRNQLPEAERLLRSDYVIVNDGNQAIIPQVIQILAFIDKKQSKQSK